MPVMHRKEMALWRSVVRYFECDRGAWEEFLSVIRPGETPSSSHGCDTAASQTDQTGQDTGAGGTHHHHHHDDYDGQGATTPPEPSHGCDDDDDDDDDRLHDGRRRSRGPRPSLRLVWYYVSTYSKHNRATLDGTLGDDVHGCYRQMLKIHTKNRFAPFCRRTRRTLSLHGSTIETNVGQLVFFRWFIEKRILDSLLDRYESVRCARGRKKQRMTRKGVTTTTTTTTNRSPRTRSGCRTGTTSRPADTTASPPTAVDARTSASTDVAADADDGGEEEMDEDSSTTSYDAKGSALGRTDSRGTTTATTNAAVTTTATTGNRVRRRRRRPNHHHTHVRVRTSAGNVRIQVRFE